MTITNQIELINKFGISQDEINQFGEVFLINYLKYHHRKYYKVSSILFLGFDEKENEKLKKIAIQSKLEIRVKNCANLNFVCFKNDFNDYRRLKKSTEIGAIILTENEFLEIFNQNQYKVFDNELIYPKLVPEEFRVVKPLSNFNKNIEVESFSLSNEDTYLVNLFSQTCNCKEFISSNKNSYEKGDLRRFCKHLILEYRETFVPENLGGLKGFLIENGNSLKSNLKKINLEKITNPIYISFEYNNYWCDIYFPDKNSFKKYSYNYNEERFSYDDKPHGHVVTLRTELNKIFGEKRQAKKINKKVSPQQNKGCASVLILGIVMTLFYIFN